MKEAPKDTYTWQMINGKMEKVLDEECYMRKLQVMARTIGCETEFLMWKDKYERLIRNCPNKQEVKAIQAMGIQELSNLLDSGYVGLGGDVHIYDVEEQKVIPVMSDRKDKLDRN